MVNRAYNRAQPKVSRKQLGFIWALAKQRGVADDEVRGMTPKGSVGQLSREQASEIIDWLKTGKQPDWRRRPKATAEPYKERRPKRLQKGVARFPTEEQMQTCDDLCRQIREEYGWTLKEEAIFWSKRHFSHGGPMNIVRTSTDCVEKIEVAKGILQRIWKARLNRQRSAEHVVAATG